MRFNLGVSIGLCGILAVAAPAFAKKKGDDLGVITVEEVPLAGVPESRTAKPAARAVKRKPAKAVVRKKALPTPSTTTTTNTAPAVATPPPALAESAAVPATESPVPPTESVATPQPADPSVGVTAPSPTVEEPSAAPDAPVAVPSPEVAPAEAPPATTALAPIPPAGAPPPPDAQPKRPEARFAGQLVQVTPQTVVVRALNGEMRTFARAGLKIETPRAGDMVTARFREGTDELVAVDVAAP